MTPIESIFRRVLDEGERERETTSVSCFMSEWGQWELEWAHKHTLNMDMDTHVYTIHIHIYHQGTMAFHLCRTCRDQSLATNQKSYEGILVIYTQLHQLLLLQQLQSARTNERWSLWMIVLLLLHSVARATNVFLMSAPYVFTGTSQSYIFIVDPFGVVADTNGDTFDPIIKIDQDDERTSMEENHDCGRSLCRLVGGIQWRNVFFLVGLLHHAVSWCTRLSLSLSLSFSLLMRHEDQRL